MYLHLGCLLNEFFLRINSSGCEYAVVALIFLLLIHELLSESTSLEFLEVIGSLHQEYLIEVNSPEEWVRLQGLIVKGRTRVASSQTLCRISLEELIDQVSCFRTKVICELELHVCDVVESGYLVRTLERRSPTYHHENDNTQAPQICRHA